MRGTQRCFCCGQEEGHGCVRGYRCGCDSKPECDLCKHCEKHHVKECTPVLRDAVAAIYLNAQIEIEALREKYEINIFAYGETL